jgi:hypothetical protein
MKQGPGVMIYDISVGGRLGWRPSYVPNKYGIRGMAQAPLVFAVCAWRVSGSLHFVGRGGNAVY